MLAAVAVNWSLVLTIVIAVLIAWLIVAVLELVIAKRKDVP